MSTTSSGPVISPRPSTAISAPKRERADPCTMVIFGALGDLSRRKLLPAIYQLMAERLVDPNFAVLGVARDEGTDDDFRAAYIIGADPGLHEERLREIERMGATIVCIQNGSGAAPERSLEIYGERVLPALRGATVNG